MNPLLGTLGDTLSDYGANPDAILMFDQDGPELLPYATLLHAQAGTAIPDADLAALLGVYEWQDSPLMFLVDGTALVDDDQFRRLRRKLALRGDAPYLGLVQPGSLTVHNLSLDRMSQRGSRVSIDDELGSTRSLTFAYLASKRPGAAYSRRVWITDIVLKLLGDAIHALLDSRACKEDADAVSLAGRALFMRFLADRNLLPPSILPLDSDPGRLFSTSANVEATSKWLDTTFNGDLLPVSPKTFRSLNADATGTLVDIMRRAPGGQLHLAWEKKWNFLDFAHIPVGVLSQAYERHMREHSPKKQRKEGAFYTPSAIANLMVRASFQPLRRDERAHTAKILDPAVGAGVFLLASFRHLVAERWTHDKARPNTAVLREILYNQLAGFDVNEDALRFAALGLYLMSIELDPEPEPVTKLVFPGDLRDRVLFMLSRPLGSLGAVPTHHLGRYDIVIGNPPWTTGTTLSGWQDVKQNVERVARSRLSAGHLPESLTPNECLDLPFVWRAMEWARPDGQMAFALHARLLFQQGEGMPDARRAIFQAVAVTGIVNGSELRKTKVWPEISAPWCLFFARNQTPGVGSGFRFVSPHLEKDLHEAGAIRLDAESAEVVTTQELMDRPELLEILFRGTHLDLEVFDRMASTKHENLGAYWSRLFVGKTNRSGNGYQSLRRSSRTRKEGDGQPGASASYLRKLKYKELTVDAMRTVWIDRTKLLDFKEKRIHDPRPPELFAGPLLVVHKSPPAATGRIRTGATDIGTIFNESYYGYSMATHPESSTLAKYLALVLGSKPVLWWMLITSGEFGFEREVVEKFIVDSMPVVPLESLNSANRLRLSNLFEDVAADVSEQSWSNIDKWVASLYGLRAEDLQIIDDTLKYNLPFSRNVVAAQARVEQFDIFREALIAELSAWSEGREEVVVTIPHLPAETPWMFMRVAVRGPTGLLSAATDPPDGWEPILKLADLLGSTESVWPGAPGHGLWLARLNQARYWSRSQARLVARRIIWRHLDALFGRPV